MKRKDIIKIIDKRIEDHKYRYDMSPETKDLIRYHLGRVKKLLVE